MSEEWRAERAEGKTSFSHHVRYKACQVQRERFFPFFASLMKLARKSFFSSSSTEVAPRPRPGGGEVIPQPYFPPLLSAIRSRLSLASGSSSSYSLFATTTTKTTTSLALRPVWFGMRSKPLSSFPSCMRRRTLFRQFLSESSCQPAL